MIFSIQSYVEDYFNRRGLADPDQYGVALARLYDRQRHGKTIPEFVTAMRRIRTVFYKRNDHIQRDTFDRRLLAPLDGRFKKKDCSSAQRQSTQRLKPAAAAYPTCRASSPPDSSTASSTLSSLRRS